MIIWVWTSYLSILRQQNFLNSLFIFIIVFRKLLLKCTAKICELFLFPHCNKTKSRLDIFRFFILNENFFIILWFNFTVRAVVKDFTESLVLQIEIIIIKIFLLFLNFLVFIFFLMGELTNLWSLVYQQFCWKIFILVWNSILNIIFIPLLNNVVLNNFEFI